MFVECFAFSTSPLLVTTLEIGRLGSSKQFYRQGNEDSNTSSDLPVPAVLGGVGGAGLELGVQAGCPAWESRLFSTLHL